MSTHSGRSGGSGQNDRGGTRADEQEFRSGVAEVETAIAAQRLLRAELRVETETPPRRLAPFAYAVAVTASATPAEPEDEIGWGRFVLLFDGAGQPGWDGKYRVIGYVRAELEPEIAADPLINEVGWTWLTEALDSRTTGYRNISGTVTTVVTQGFGGKQDEPTSSSFELRASWSPAAAGESLPEFGGHLDALCNVVCVAAGLPQLAPGVAALRPPHRRPRS